MPYTPPPDYIPPPDAKASGYIPPPDYVPPPDAVEAKPEMPPTFGAIPEKDGSVSLIPTLDASGRALNPEEAEAQYHKTGNKFGTYASVGEAQKAGQDLYTKQLNAPMMASHGQPGPIPSHMSLGEAAKQVAGQYVGSSARGDVGTSFDPRAIYANLGKGFYSGLIGEPLGMASKAYGAAINLGNRLLAPVVGGGAPLGNPDDISGALEKASEWAKKTGESYMHYAPKGYEPGVVGGLTQMAPSIMAGRLGGQQAAGAIFGTQMGNQAIERAKASGASPAVQLAMGTAGALAGGGFGMLRPGAEAIGGIAPTLGERGAQAATGGLMLGGITTALNATEKALYNPSKGVLDDVPESMLTGFVLGGLEAKGNPVTERQANAIAKMARENPEEFSNKYKDVLGPAITQLREQAAHERTHEQAIADADAAMAKVDLKSARQFELEAQSLKPPTRPAFREATPEEAARAGRYEPLTAKAITPEVEQAAQEAMRPGGGATVTEPAKPMTAEQLSPEDATRLADLHQQRLDNETALDAASRGRSKAARAEVDRLTQNQSVIENEIAKIQLGVKEPEKGPSLPVAESTEYQGQRQGSLMGPNDEQLVARDPETGKDIGRLWVTKTDNGFEVRKVETDPEFRGRGVATKLYKEAADKYGPYAGNTDQTPEGKALVDSLRQTHPEIFGETPSKTDQFGPYVEAKNTGGGWKARNFDPNGIWTKALQRGDYTELNLPKGEKIRVVRAEAPDGFETRLMAFDESGKPVGDLDFSRVANEHPNVVVDENWRRKGVATSLYDFAAKTGWQVPALEHPEAVRTPEGQAFREAYARRRHTASELTPDYGYPEHLKEAASTAHLFTQEQANEAVESLKAHAKSQVMSLQSVDEPTKERLIRAIDNENMHQLERILDKSNLSIQDEDAMSLMGMGGNPLLLEDAIRLKRHIGNDYYSDATIPEIERSIGAHLFAHASRDIGSDPVATRSMLDAFNEYAKRGKTLDDLKKAIGSQARQRGLTGEQLDTMLNGFKTASEKVGIKLDLGGQKTIGMRGDLYSGLDIPKTLRDTAEAAKRELGLPEGATDADLGREVMNRIGRLGSSVKETVVRIMSKIKGIGRDMAQALAEHFHQALSGTKHGQLGAIGKEVKAYTPDEEAHYQAESQAMRDMISRRYPGEENAAKRAELYKKIPTKSQMIADLRGEKAPELVNPEAPTYERGKGLVKGLAQPIRDMGKVARLLVSGDNTAANRVFDELKNRQVIPEPYREGSGKPVELVKPAIFGEDTPTIKKDFGYDPEKHGLAKDFNHLMRSPHNIEEPVFGRSNTPTQDAQMGIVAMMHNAKNMSEYFKDLFRSNRIEDHSPEMLAEAKPLFKEFQKARAELEPLQAQQEALRNDARKAAGGPREAEAKSRLAQWESENGSKLGKAVGRLRAVSDAHEAMLKKFASQYGDARVALAAEYPKGQIPDWIKLSPEEEKAADGFRAMMDKVKARLKEQGIPTIDGNYVTHMTRYLAEDTGMPSFANRTPKEVLGFQHREQDSSQWLPSAHAAAADYVPSVSRKMAFQHFYDKWRPMIDPSNREGFANPASPNYAPNASKYLTQMFKTMETPEAQNYADKAINALRNYENVKLLSANIRVGWKHLAGKLTSLVAQNDVWNAPGAQAQLKAAIGKFSQEGPIRTAISKLGIDNADWTKKAQLVDYFANTKEILGFLRENPITSGVKELDRYGVTSAKTNRAFTRMFGPKAPDAIAAIRRGMQTVTSNPVAAVEAWENGLDLMTSIEKGHAKGLEPAQNIKAAMSNILDFNFRGGVDAPGMVKDKSTRYLVQFAQTPMKLAELKAKLIVNGLKGGQDIYGTDHTANLIKHVVATGIAFQVAKQLGVNVADSILHLPFMNTDQWKRIANMVYYGAKMRMGNDPVAKRKYLDAKAGMLGDREGAFMGSPIFDIGKDVNTLVGAGPTGLIKDMPVYNQIKAVATQKPPKGFDSVSSYLTNERTERSKRQMERQSIERGRREMRYQERRVKQK